MNKYEAIVIGQFAQLYRDHVYWLGNGKATDVIEVADILNKETAPLLETIAAKDARIAELEAQLAELTAPEPVICDNCNSVIEGVAHTRYGLHAEYTLCGDCVTENED